jgi:hypothetical protein
MKLLMTLILALIGCASQQVPFQKSNNSVGYSVEEKNTDNFIIKSQLPADSDPKWIYKYIGRAVGEECLQKGFDFFDYTEPQNGVSEGFCFKENKRKALAVTFVPAGLDSTPTEFVGENLNQKSNTSLQVGDKFVKVEGKKIESVSELKSLAFSNRNKKGLNVKIELVRADKNLTINEPLADMTGGCYDQESLASLRDSIK